ncbi:12134_t:CDS:1 [Acaulospora colombiana]|uniref:12134_t:CDS:1 n=1 Tax=Acaulospora colombiana TaxID=27376 RepID=A0ACA9L9Z0_9GLOM|nr:12134_t:CDS:1 [Acaulospora colombiana]
MSEILGSNPNLFSNSLIYSTVQPFMDEEIEHGDIQFVGNDRQYEDCVSLVENNELGDIVVQLPQGDQDSDKVLVKQETQSTIMGDYFDEKLEFEQDNLFNLKDNDQTSQVESMAAVTMQLDELPWSLPPGFAQRDTILRPFYFKYMNLSEEQIAYAIETKLNINSLSTPYSASSSSIADQENAFLNTSPLPIACDDWNSSNDSVDAIFRDYVHVSDESLIGEQELMKKCLWSKKNHTNAQMTASALDGDQQNDKITNEEVNNAKDEQEECHSPSSDARLAALLLESNQQSDEITNEEVSDFCDTDTEIDASALNDGRQNDEIANEKSIDAKEVEETCLCPNRSSQPATLALDHDRQNDEITDGRGSSARKKSDLTEKCLISEKINSNVQQTASTLDYYQENDKIASGRNADVDEEQELVEECLLLEKIDPDKQSTEQILDEQQNDGIMTEEITNAKEEQDVQIKIESTTPTSENFDHDLNDSPKFISFSPSQTPPSVCKRNIRLEKLFHFQRPSLLDSPSTFDRNRNAKKSHVGVDDRSLMIFKYEKLNSTSSTSTIINDTSVARPQAESSITSNKLNGVLLTQPQPSIVPTDDDVTSSQDQLSVPLINTNDGRQPSNSIIISHQETVDVASSGLHEEQLVTSDRNVAKPSNERSRSVDRESSIIPVSRSSSVDPSWRYATKKTRSRWTSTELKALEQGMELFGTSWAQIIEKYGRENGPLSNRNPVQLKDKARNEKLRRLKMELPLGIFEKATGGIENE